MHRRWFINRTNKDFLSYLSRNASISPVMAQILVNRGIRTVPDIHDFFFSGIANLSDPFELPGMKQAVERIKSAVRNGERVLVHGDYDADGLTATAIMVSTLRSAGLDVHSFIPHRINHGYGFNPHALHMAKTIGAKLIITVDCGITAFDAAAAAAAERIDVIITDHHEPMVSPAADSRSEGDAPAGDLFLVPEAAAVVNPKLIPGSGLAILSGAGIAFKLSHALALDGNAAVSEEDVLGLLDLAALGTLADVVPLKGENRVILREGLRAVMNGARPAMKALRTVCGLDQRELNARLLSFTIIPRINAAGRIADANDVVRLLLTESDEEALDLSSWLDRLNAERQKIEEEVHAEALAAVRSGDNDSVIVVSGHGWHRGVLGIVASRIAEAFSLPTFVFSVEDGIAKGSARSIPSFDVYEGLVRCRGMLLAFGGHAQAAGITLEAGNMGKFEDSMRAVVRERSDADLLVPTLEIDASLSLTEVTHSFIKELAMLEPLGYGNPEPLFGTKDLEVVGPRLVGTNHLKMKVKKRGCSIDAIGFDMGHCLREIRPAGTVDIAFTPAVNEWNGGKNLQLILKACRPSR